MAGISTEPSRGGGRFDLQAAACQLARLSRSAHYLSRGRGESGGRRPCTPAAARRLCASQPPRARESGGHNSVAHK